MFNIVEFIRKHYFIFLFLFLEAIALLITSYEQNKQKAFFINSSNFFTSTIYKNIFLISDFFNLRSENEKLIIENRNLRNQLQIIDSLKQHIIEDTIRKTTYQYISGKVIKNSTSAENNFITINRGTADGIVQDMGVVNPVGVVGIITNVSKHFSIALSILNNMNSIGCKLKNTNYFGSASWDGKNYRQIILNGIPNHVTITKGDTVVTSGFGSIFPENIIVGTIDTAWKKHDTNFYTIKLNLIVDFKRLTSVSLIKNIYINEQKQLEQKTSDFL